MQPFAYQRVHALEEAVSLLASDAEARLLAGGMTLIPTIKQRLAAPSRLLDIAGLAALRGIALSDGRLSIGAGTRHAMVAADRTVLGAIPALAALAAGIGDPQVRARGTLGGSIANNDPAADYPAAVLALDATVRTDRRRIAADDFFTGMFETALAADEIVVGVDFAVPGRAAYAKFAHPASGYAMCGVFVADFGARCRVAVTGVAPCVFRWTDAEDALAAGDAAAITRLRLSADGLNEDFHAPAEYRAHLATVMLKRAIDRLEAGR